MAFTNTVARYASFGTIQSIPGEVIDSEHLDVIDTALSLGAAFRGLAAGSDGGLVVTVVKDVKR